MPDRFWRSKRILVTGHTGFKGAWLSLWLGSLGANVVGYSRRAAAPELSGLESFAGDICDRDALQRALRSARPEVIFHLAAQPLVRRAFHDPIDSYRTNILGTATLLDTIRHCDSVRSVLVVTTDRCYQPGGAGRPYRESDPLGGLDPYSSSKACMELVASAFRDSWLADAGVGVGTARAGNMIGGGDWACDRLIPDMIRSFAKGDAVTLRNPQARRPWQYVLEALRGYLLLGEQLYTNPHAASGGWNFGPDPNDIRSVQWIAARLAQAWGADASWGVQPGALPQESQMVRLDCSRAAAHLGWAPVLSLESALNETAAWYRDFYQGTDPREAYLARLAAYRSLLAAKERIVSPTAAAR